jgi:hypothetical protein
MNTSHSNTFALRSRATFTAARAVFLAFCLSALAATAPAQSNYFRQAQQQRTPPVLQQQQPDAQTQTPAPPAADDESESLTLDEKLATRPRVTDPSAILRTARTVFIHSKTVFVKDSEVENALRKRPEFQAWGMIVTRDESRADLIVEVERKVLTKRFVFTVVEPQTLTVVASGKARSIVFGDTIAHKVAEKFVNRVKPFRT